jgi:hypothetical protein
MSETLKVTSFGVVGDGKTDDTKAIQAVVDKALPGDIVKFPAGTYMIDATKGIRPHNNNHLILDPGATLQTIPNNSDGDYAVIDIQNVQNVCVAGGIIKGDRDKHTGPIHKGMCIKIGATADNITISKVTAVNSSMDGFYVGSNAGYEASRVIFTECNAINNARQGLSIVGVWDIQVLSSCFSQTGGVDPGDGIDIEPDKGNVIENVVIKNCIFAANKGSHIEIAGKRGTITKLAIGGCSFDSKSQPIKVGGVPKTISIGFWTQVAGFFGNYSGYPKVFVL